LGEALKGGGRESAPYRMRSMILTELRKPVQENMASKKKERIQGTLAASKENTSATVKERKNKTNLNNNP